MRFIVYMTALIFLLTSCKDDANRKIVEATSPNGHAFHHMPISEAGVTDITIRVSWPMDWIHGAGNNVVAPYIGADTIISGGTQSMQPKEILEFFNERNASGSMVALLNSVVGELSFPNNYTEEVVSLASELLANPQFDPAWIERSKATLYARMDQLQEQTNMRMWNVARKKILGEQPAYEALSLTNLEQIQAVTRSDLVAWHHNTITKNEMMIVITGAITTEDAGDVIDKLLEKLPEGTPAQIPVMTTNYDPVTILLHLPDAQKTTLGLLAPIENVVWEQRLLEHLALTQMERALFDALRTQLRATYGFQAGLSEYDIKQRILFINGEVEAKNLAAARDVVLKTYGRFVAEATFDDIKSDSARLSAEINEQAKYVSSSAALISRLLARDDHSLDLQKVADDIRNLDTTDLVEHMRHAFPTADALMVVAASPDATALPGACVVTSLSEVLKCQ